MNHTEPLNKLVGKRIKLVQMFDDPFPISPNTEGLIINYGYDCLTVKWDNGRILGVIVDVDIYEILNQ
jgi:hypothetical protein